MQSKFVRKFGFSTFSKGLASLVECYQSMNRVILAISLLSIYALSACQSDDEQDCIAQTWHYDQDGDGLGTPDSLVVQCDSIPGWVRNGLDEDDEPKEPEVAPTNPRVPFVFTPGELKPFFLNQTDSPYGFWFYAPPEYDSLANAEYPLLIHLHGLGERGNSANNPASMNIILWNGAPKLIRLNQWVVNNPMIVVAPQTTVNWQANTLHNFITFLIVELHVDISRIYMTGLSMGANGTFDYVSGKGAEAYTAAIVPIAGWGNTTTGAQFEDVAVWAFHGDADPIVAVTGSMVMIDSINARNPVIPAKLTIYPGVTHDSWARTYDGTGMGDESAEYAPFDQSIYDWMYQYQK